MFVQGSVGRVKKLSVVIGKRGRGFGITASEMITFRDQSLLHNFSFNRSLNSGANLGFKSITDNRLRQTKCLLFINFSSNSSSCKEH